MKHRPSYRYLTLLLGQAGHRIDQELPGTDRPDLVEQFLTVHDTWLHQPLSAALPGPTEK